MRRVSLRWIAIGLFVGWLGLLATSHGVLIWSETRQPQTAVEQRLPTASRVSDQQSVPLRGYLRTKTATERQVTMMMELLRERNAMIAEREQVNRPKVRKILDTTGS